MPLQEIRKKRGYSQSELAIRSGVPLKTIQGYECGRININGASLDKLCNFAIALDCKLSDIITDGELKSKIKLVMKEKNSSK